MTTKASRAGAWVQTPQIVTDSFQNGQHQVGTVTTISPLPVQEHVTRPLCRLLWACMHCLDLNARSCFYTFSLQDPHQSQHTEEDCCCLVQYDAHLHKPRHPQTELYSSTGPIQCRAPSSAELTVLVVHFCTPRTHIPYCCLQMLSAPLLLHPTLTKNHHPCRVKC